MVFCNSKATAILLLFALIALACIRSGSASAELEQAELQARLVSGQPSEEVQRQEYREASVPSIEGYEPPHIGGDVEQGTGAGAVAARGGHIEGQVEEPLEEDANTCTVCFEKCATDPYCAAHHSFCETCTVEFHSRAPRCPLCRSGPTAEVAALLAPKVQQLQSERMEEEESQGWEALARMAGELPDAELERLNMLPGPRAFRAELEGHVTERRDRRATQRASRRRANCNTAIAFFLLGACVTVPMIGPALGWWQYPAVSSSSSWSESSNEETVEGWSPPSPPPPPPHPPFALLRQRGRG